MSENPTFSAMDPLLAQQRKEQAAQREAALAIQKEAEARAAKELKAELQRNRDAAEEKARQEVREKRAEVLKAEAEKEQYRKYFTEPRPYALSGLAVDQVALLNRQKDRHQNIEWLLETIDEVRNILDLRSAGAQDAGSLLLSSANIDAAARALGIESYLGTKKAAPTANLNTTIARLKEWVETRPEIGHAIDRLLETSGGTLLLAALTRDPATCKAYADSIIADEKAATAAEQKRGGGLDKPHAIFAAHRETANRRNVLERQIRQVLRGEAVSTAFIAPVAEAKRIDLPEHWQDMLGNDYGAEIVKGGKAAKISSTRYPDNSFSIEIAAGNEALGAFTGKLKTLETSCKRRQHEEKLEEEFAGHGFIRTEKQGKPVLRHPEYDIDLPLGDESMHKKDKLAEDARTAYEEKAADQHNLLTRAREIGIRIIGDGDPPARGPVDLRHDAFGKQILTERGYLDDKDTENVKGLIRQVERKSMANAVSANPEKNGRNVWQPEPGQTMLVLDANILRTLAAERNAAGDTWLDLIENTAKLHNVKIIIPALIAEWELQGKIPLFNAAGKCTGYEQIKTAFQDRSHFLHLVADPISQFLRTASRAHRDSKDGKIHFEPGINENIIVWDTEKDKGFYNKAREKKKAFAVDKIKKKNAGEHAIERVIEDLPIAPVIIISDDTSYFKHAPIVNMPQRMPVGFDTLENYLNAEIKTRKLQLCDELNETDSLSASYIKNSASNYWNKKKEEYFSGTDKVVISDYIVSTGEFSIRGKNRRADAPLADDISDVVRNGVAQQKTSSGHHPSITGIPSGKSWANPAMKPIVPQRSIAPERIHEREGASLGIV